MTNIVNFPKIENEKPLPERVFYIGFRYVGPFCQDVQIYLLKEMV